MATHLSKATLSEVERDIEARRRLVVLITRSAEQYGPGLLILHDGLGELPGDELDCYLFPTVRPSAFDPT
jgi:hypothetical protein